MNLQRRDPELQYEEYSRLNTSLFSVYENLCPNVNNKQLAHSNSTVNLDSPCANILSQTALVISHKVDISDVFVGYTNAKKYTIMDIYGQVVGYIVEKEVTKRSLFKQLGGSGRSFKLAVLNQQKRPILTISRKFSAISSRVRIENEIGDLIGESHQKFHITRRKYKLLTKSSVFAKIDAPTLSHKFQVRDHQDKVIASVNRNYSESANEIRLDNGIYAIIMDPYLLYTEQKSPMHSFDKIDYNLHNISDKPLSLDERAVLLANAISIDYDYYTLNT